MKTSGRINHNWEWQYGLIMMMMIYISIIINLLIFQELKSPTNNNEQQKKFPSLHEVNVFHFKELRENGKYQLISDYFHRYLMEIHIKKFRNGETIVRFPQ